VLIGDVTRATIPLFSRQLAIKWSRWGTLDQQRRRLP